MTSANKKFGYYDFKVSYQYPMSNGTPMEITSKGETHVQERSEKETKDVGREKKTKDHPPWRAQRTTLHQVQKVQETIPPRPKFLFPGDSKKGQTTTNTSARHNL